MASRGKTSDQQRLGEQRLKALQAQEARGDELTAGEQVAYRRLSRTMQSSSGAEEPNEQPTTPSEWLAARRATGKQAAYEQQAAEQRIADLRWAIGLPEDEE